MVGNALLDYVFPRVCHVCGVRLPDGCEYICPVCNMRLSRTGFHRVADNPMERRFLGRVRFERATGHFFYAPGAPLATLMYDLKYHRFEGLAVYMGRLVGEELLPAGFFAGVDGVTYVPMHWLKHGKRGYNPAQRIAHGVCMQTDLPLLDILRASRPHRTQTSMTLEGRIKNARGIFRALDLPSQLRPDAHVLIVDDVCTTGSTLISAASSLLSRYPDMRVSMLTLGVTV